MGQWPLEIAEKRGWMFDGVRVLFSYQGGRRSQGYVVLAVGVGLWGKGWCVNRFLGEEFKVEGGKWLSLKKYLFYFIVVGVEVEEAARSYVRLRSRGRQGLGSKMCW